MKLFLFILFSLIFINGTKSELNTTILSISIYNNDFELFENIIEREKRESNSLIESNKEENDNNSKDPINNSKKEIQPKTKEDIIQNDNKNDNINNSKSPVNQDKNNNNGKSELTNSKNKKPTKNNLKRLLKRLKKLKKKILNRKNTNNNERPQIQDINERPQIQDINQRPKIEAFKVNGQTFLRCKRGTPGSSCDKSLDDDGFTVVK